MHWIQEFASGIGTESAVVILEPDALTVTTCLSDVQIAERMALLSFAVEMFESKPDVDVYIDVGHSQVLPADEAASLLKRAGIFRATGFSLNVSNFQPLDDLVPYGLELSEAIGRDGGTHFVIDTSRNGVGAWDTNSPETWCNPPGRAVGVSPTTETADPLIDAYLWIKRPGESDGECRDGPAAGDWYPEYDLVW